jgi:hypothetical protein
MAPAEGGLSWLFTLQQDGAPPHFHLAVRAFLDNQLPESLIEHRGPTPWPSRSPDLSPLDFFFWGFVKDCIYRPPMSQSLPELQGQISDVATQVIAAMLQHTWEEFQYCLDIWSITHGAHIEHVWTKNELFPYMHQELFNCCNCSGALNIDHCNHFNHFETSCILVDKTRPWILLTRGLKKRMWSIRKCEGIMG